MTIADIFGGWWFVGVFNDSTSARISTEGLYDGPHSSVEWVVEASSSNLCSKQSHVDRFSACDMAAFNGPARFTGLDVVGPTKEMAEVDLVQHAVQVASPSPVWSVSQLLAQGFDVTYSGLERPARFPSWPPNRRLSTCGPDAVDVVGRCYAAASGATPRPIDAADGGMMGACVPARWATQRVWSRSGKASRR